MDFIVVIVKLIESLAALAWPILIGFCIFVAFRIVGTGGGDWARQRFEDAKEINFKLFGMELGLTGASRAEIAHDQQEQLDRLFVDVERLKGQIEKTGRRRKTSQNTNRPLIVAAFGGKSRYPELVRSLKARGYDVVQISAHDDIGSLMDKNTGKLIIVVTNLLHVEDGNRNYTGGTEFADRIKDKWPEATVVIYTNVTAQSRRNRVIENSKAEASVTNPSELADFIATKL